MEIANLAIGVALISGAKDTLSALIGKGEKAEKGLSFDLYYTETGYALKAAGKKREAEALYKKSRGTEQTEYTLSPFALYFES